MAEKDKKDVNTVMKSGENASEEKPKSTNPKKNLFHDPLPKWLVLPLDAKLPLVPGSQNVQLHTTKLGEKVIFTDHNSSWGKVMFSHACVSHSIQRGGAILSRGAIFSRGCHP